MNKKVKKQLRLEYRTKRAQIPETEKRKSEFNITQSFLNADVYLEAQEVLCYVSTKDEIDTRGIISDALRNGKKVFVPKCTDQKGVMLFYRIDSFDDLKEGRYGIFEPVNISADNEWRQTDKKSVCVVPALCCDRFGNRLGYGGGYYDRFLHNFNGKTICLCYSVFSNVDLPVEEYDIPCDIVIKG